MSRLLHLSDLHFGTVDDRLVAPLLALADEWRPDATLVSGDLTQRARSGQFAAARDFLARLPGPMLVVPGNHDMPLYNVPIRLAAPFAEYARAFGPMLEPVLSLPDAVIQGVNTANPLVWKAGRLRRASVERLRASFSGADPAQWRIAVLHHAPVAAADGTPADIADPGQALADLAAAGAQIVLSGHTHMPHSGFADTAAGVLFLQVGTAISTRRKTGANDFAVIDLAPDSLTVRPFIAPEGQRFAAAPPVSFRRSDRGWQAG